MDEICRVCGSDDKILLPIFTNGDRQYAKEINTCLPTKVTKHDGTSSKICHSCVFRLEIGFSLISLFHSFDVKRNGWNAKNNVCYLCMSNKGTLGSLLKFTQYVDYIDKDLSCKVNKQKKSLLNICHQCAYKLEELHSLREKCMGQREVPLEKAGTGRRSSELTAIPVLSVSNTPVYNRFSKTRLRKTPVNNILNNMEIMEYCVECNKVIFDNKCKCHGRRNAKFIPFSQCKVQITDCEKFPDIRKVVKTTPSRKRHASPSLDSFNSKKVKRGGKRDNSDNGDFSTRSPSFRIHGSTPSRKGAVASFFTDLSTTPRKSNRRLSTEQQTPKAYEEQYEEFTLEPGPSKRPRKPVTKVYTPERRNISSETVIMQKSSRAKSEKRSVTGRMPHVVLKIKKDSKSPKGRARKNNKESSVAGKTLKGTKIVKARGRPRSSVPSDKEHKIVRPKGRPKKIATSDGDLPVRKARSTKVKKIEKATPYTCQQCWETLPSTVEGKLHALSHESPAVPVIELTRCNTLPLFKKCYMKYIELCSVKRHEDSSLNSREVVQGILNDIIEKVTNSKDDDLVSTNSDVEYIQDDTDRNPEGVSIIEETNIENDAKEDDNPIEVDDYVVELENSEQGNTNEVDTEKGTFVSGSENDSEINAKEDDNLSRAENDFQVNQECDLNRSENDEIDQEYDLNRSKNEVEMDQERDLKMPEYNVENDINNDDYASESENESSGNGEEEIIVCDGAGKDIEKGNSDNENYSDMVEHDENQISVNEVETACTQTNDPENCIASDEEIGDANSEVDNVMDDNVIDNSEITNNGVYNECVNGDSPVSGEDDGSLICADSYQDQDRDLNRSENSGFVGEDNDIAMNTDKGYYYYKPPSPVRANDYSPIHSDEDFD